MIFKKHIYRLFSLVLLFSLAGCKTSKMNMPVLKEAPAAFSIKTDSAAPGMISWKEFFDDEHLLKLIDTALKNNPDLQIAIQRIDMARAAVRVREKAFLPTVNAAASGGARRFGEYTMDGIGNYDTNFSENLDEDKRIPKHLPDYFIGFQSSWEIDLWGKLKSRKKAAYSRLLVSEKGRQLVITSLVSEVAKRYYLLLELDNEKQIIRENILLQERAYEVTKLQKEAGRANELAVKQVLAQLLNTRSLEVKTNQRIIETENNLNFLLGNFSGPIERGKPILEQTLPEEIDAGIPATALRRRPDIQQAEFQLQAAKADVAAARAAFYPSLAITSSVGLQSFDASKLFNPTSLAYSLLGGLSAPLINRSAIKADLKINSATALESLYTYQKSLLQGFQEVVIGLNRIENLGDISDLKQLEVNTLTEAVATSNDLFAAGFASYLEVISAQKSVLEAELELANTRKEQFHAVIDVYRSLGGGWQE